ncbi:MAG: cytochrome P450 [Deltaproteobacteria bacterium]|nr:cytochrome P450 [Deltaproteobacteria bacterium]
MEPRCVLAPDDIRLSDLGFWKRPPEEREGAFATLRRERPISFHEEPEVALLGKGPGFWALTRYADVLEVSRQPEIFSSARGGVNIIDMPPDFTEFFGSMIVMDDPRHARLRRIVSRGFTPGMLRSVDASVEIAARSIIDAVIDKGSCDFVFDIAAALPLKIICDMMGIAAADYQFVFDRTNIILGAGDPEYVADPATIVPALLHAGQELSQLMQDLAAHRREHPTDDLTSALLHAEVDGERLSDAEIGSFFVLLVAAGNETTRNAISHGMKALCDYPDQRRLWASDFERLAPGAVEEIVRWASPVIHFRRTATRDTEIGGDRGQPHTGAGGGDRGQPHTGAGGRVQKIRAGDKVVMWYNSANRDETVFDDPYRFDIRRTPNDHVGFGGPGPHFCMGAHLARREITVMFRELLRRLPDLQITAEPERLLSFFIHGIKRMPCHFTPRR